MFRSAKGALSPFLLICVCGCSPKSSRVSSRDFGGTLVPLWSMPYGCERGLHLGWRTVSLLDREGLADNYFWTLDLANGRVLGHSEENAKPEAFPVDSHVELSAGTLKPVDSLAKSMTPPGFNPLVLTDKFVFAKKRWLSFEVPRFVRHSEVVIVERSSRKVVWHFGASDIAVQASLDRVVVCGYQRTFAFLPAESRPQAVTDFYAAIHHGDVETVIALFDAWKKTPLYDLDGDDPLTVAAKEGKTDVVKELLVRKVSPDSEAADGYPPLLAAISWHPELVPLLLNAGADPNNDGQRWEFPLTAAIENLDNAAVDQLLKSGARINAADQVSGQTALHAAVLYRNYVGIETLLKSGADPRIKDFDGKTPIELADPNECLSHLFSGGRVSDRPVACAPIQTTSDEVHFQP